MVQLLKQGGRTDYNYKEFIVDTEADMVDIQLDEDICAGSTCFIVSTGQVFMLNNKKEWVAL